MLDSLDTVIILLTPFACLILRISSSPFIFLRSTPRYEPIKLQPIYSPRYLKPPKATDRLWISGCRAASGSRWWSMGIPLDTPGYPWGSLLISRGGSHVYLVSMLIILLRLLPFQSHFVSRVFIHFFIPFRTSVNRYSPFRMAYTAAALAAYSTMPCGTVSTSSYGTTVKPPTMSMAFNMSPYGKQGRRNYRSISIWELCMLEYCPFSRVFSLHTGRRGLQKDLHCEFNREKEERMIWLP